MISLKYKNEFERIVRSKLYRDRLRMLFTTNDEDEILNTSFENFKNELTTNLYMIPLKESLAIYLNSHLEFLVYYYNKVVFFSGLDEDEIKKLTKEFNIPKTTSFGKVPSIWRSLFHLLKDLFLSYNIDFKEQCRKHNNNKDLEHEFLFDFIYNERAKIDFLNSEVNEQFNDMFNKGQMLYLLEKIGIKETNLINGAIISQTAKHKLLSQIVSLNTRDVKKFFNDGIQEICSPDKIIEVDKYFNKITKSNSK